MRLGSLCTGYGGLDMAVEAHYGTTTAWHAEIDKDCSQVLDHHWPGVPNLGDLTMIDWDQVEPVDVLCAGFPCQPVSLAGNRRRSGMDDERWLWDDIERCVGVLAPGVVVLENVAAITLIGGPRIVASLTGLGYNLKWGVVRASDAGAPHRRARWFCIATDTDGPAGSQRYERPAARLDPPFGRHPPGCPPDNVTDGLRVAPEVAEWMMGLRRGFVTGRGLSYTATMRMLGNGVCPQQAALALRLLDER